MADAFRLIVATLAERALWTCESAETCVERVAERAEIKLLSALSALIRFDVSTATRTETSFEVVLVLPPVALFAETRLTRDV
jgi:hypothetical protein